LLKGKNKKHKKLPLRAGVFDFEAILKEKSKKDGHYKSIFFAIIKARR